MKTSKRIAFYNRRGFSVFDNLLSVALWTIAGVMLVIAWQYFIAEPTTANALAMRMTDLSSAAKQYIVANDATLKSQTSSGALISVPAGRSSSTGTIPANSLQGQGFLPASFIDTGPYNNQTSLVIKQALNPLTNLPTGQLEAYLVQVNGRAIPDRILGLATQIMGASGGFYPSTGGGNIRGLKGGWLLPIAQLNAAVAVQPSHLMMAVTGLGNGYNTAIGDYLWRDNIGVPEANRMNTNIDLNSNSLNNVQNITSPSALAALHVLSKLDAELIIPPSTAATTATYVNPNTGVEYPYYLRPDGKTKLNLFDLTTKIADGSMVGPSGKNYPNGLTLADVLPVYVPKDLYTITGNATGSVVNKPNCGGTTGNSHPELARLSAYPISGYQELYPSTQTTVSVGANTTAVVQDAVLTQNGYNVALNVSHVTLNIPDPYSLTATSNSNVYGERQAVYATDLGASWRINFTNFSGQLFDVNGNPGGFGASSLFSNTYPIQAIVQTFCYYGP